MLTEEQKKKLKDAGYSDADIVLYEKRKSGAGLVTGKTDQGFVKDTIGDVVDTGKNVAKNVWGGVVDASDDMAEYQVKEKKTFGDAFRAGTRALGNVGWGISKGIGDVIMGVGKVGLSQKNEDYVKEKVVPGVGSAFKTAGDTVRNVSSAVAPEYTAKMAGGVDVIAEKLGLNENLEQTMYQNFKNKYPEASKDLEALGGIVSFGVDLATMGTGGTLAKQTAQKTTDALVDTARTARGAFGRTPPPPPPPGGAGALATGAEEVAPALRSRIPGVGTPDFGTGATAQGVKQTAKEVGEFGVQQVTGLNIDDVKTILANPTKYEEAIKSGVNKLSLAERIKQGVDAIRKSASDTGADYQAFRASQAPVKVRPGWLVEQLANSGFKVVDDVVTAGTKSVTRDAGDIRALQKFYDDWSRNTNLTAEEFLNMRSDLAVLSKFERPMGKSATLETIAKGIRKSLNNEFRDQIPGLKIVDKKNTELRGVLRDIDKQLFDEAGNLRDTDITKIFNSTNKGRVQMMRVLKQIDPNIEDVIRMARTVSNVEDAMGFKVGTYLRGGLSAGVTLANPMAGLLMFMVSNPKTFVRFLLWVGKKYPSLADNLVSASYKLSKGEALNLAEKDAMKVAISQPAEVAQQFVEQEAKNVVEDTARKAGTESGHMDLGAMIDDLTGGGKKKSNVVAPKRQAGTAGTLSQTGQKAVSSANDTTLVAEAKKYKTATKFVEAKFNEWFRGLSDEKKSFYTANNSERIAVYDKMKSELTSVWNKNAKPTLKNTKTARVGENEALSFLANKYIGNEVPAIRKGNRFWVGDSAMTDEQLLSNALKDIKFSAKFPDRARPDIQEITDAYNSAIKAGGKYGDRASVVRFVPTTQENVRKAVDKSVKYQPEFAKTATRIADELGLDIKIGDPKGATTKGFNRIVEKGSGEKGGNLLDVGDLNRAVLFVKKLDGIDAPGGLLDEIVSKAKIAFGAVTEIKKTIGTPSYNKVIVNVKTPAGTAELQFTTKGMWEAKTAGGGDLLYGLERAPTTPKEVAQALGKIMEDLYSGKDSVLSRISKEINEGGTTRDPIRDINYAGTPHVSVTPFPERSVILKGEVTHGNIAKFLSDNFDLLQKKGYGLGGWFNKETGETYLDVAVLVPKEKTASGIKLSKDANQISAFDLEKFEEIKTGGTGTKMGATPLAERQKMVDEIFSQRDNLDELRNEVQVLRGEQKPIGGDGFKRGDTWVEMSDVVARERFDIPKLKKLSFGGSDRDVYELPGGNVVKIAKTARGLAQNAMADWYASSQGLIPELKEVGRNYVVFEKVLPPDANVKAMVKELNKSVPYIVKGGSPQDVYWKKIIDFTKIMEKYGYPGEGLLDYGDELLWGDMKAIRNWGTKDGKPILLDEGSLNGKFVTEFQTSAQKGIKNLNSPEFGEIYRISKALRKKYGDLDKKTMYGITGLLIGGSGVTQ